MIRIINKIFSYLSNLGKEGTAESSKRFISLYAVLTLGTYVVIGFTTVNNMEYVLGEILTFTLALLGVAVWEKTSNNKTKNKKDESSE